MRSLIIGILTFFAWSLFSIYIYVCVINQLCTETVDMQVNEVSIDPTADYKMKQNQLATEKLVIPQELIIYFAFDKSEFNSTDITKQYFDESVAYLNQKKEARLHIVGHTDAIGTKAYNDALGNRRAQSIQRHFTSLGLSPEVIKIESEGESNPVDNNQTKQGRANNRRAVITIK